MRGPFAVGKQFLDKTSGAKQKEAGNKKQNRQHGIRQRRWTARTNRSHSGGVWEELDQVRFCQESASNPPWPRRGRERAWEQQTRGVAAGRSDRAIGTGEEIADSEGAEIRKTLILKNRNDLEDGPKNLRVKFNQLTGWSLQSLSVF